MISEKKFVEIIKDIKDTNKFYDEINDVYAERSLDYFPIGMSGFLIDDIVDILENMFNDNDRFISWWVFEREFGRRDPYVEVEDEKLYLNTPEELYDFLIKYYKDNFND